MIRQTGVYRSVRIGDENVRAFVPAPLPPTDPPLKMEGELNDLHASAITELARLSLAGAMAPSLDSFLFGFIRAEAVASSQIEGVQAALPDVLEFEATAQADRPDDVQEVCNYVDALEYSRRQLSDPSGLPLCIRLLCQAHGILMRGARGRDKMPGQIRQSQNWVGGSRPGNASLVPPPPWELSAVLGTLEWWWHQASDLPPLVRAGLIHAQFETIHPFLDGNGRIGRLLISLLLEHWELLDHPLLNISIAIKRRQHDYYERLSAIRIEGDWEGWTSFFLNCVCEAADCGIQIAQSANDLARRDRGRILNHPNCTVAAVQLIELLPWRPILTVAAASRLLDLSEPPARKAIGLLQCLGILRETTGRKRGRVYCYSELIDYLTANLNRQVHASGAYEEIKQYPSPA